jgi:NAD(P)-dependent dehydrogenase (short-subunit alcohol dehydrogenase family)
MTTKPFFKDEFGGKVALITGAGSGIGKATAERLALMGAKVVLVDLNAKAIEKVAAHIEAMGGESAPFVADVTDPDQIKAAVDFAEKTYGGLHLALNNAGIGGPQGLLADIDIEGYRKLMAVNLDSVFYGMFYEIPAMLRAGAGAIVNTSSILGIVGTATAVPYVTAKHGVTGMTKAAALGYADKNIRINSIHPGYIDTPLLKDMDKEAREELVNQHAQRRFGTDDEIAETIVFILSDRSSFTSGAQFVVDGGYTTH